MFDNRIIKVKTIYFEIPRFPNIDFSAELSDDGKSITTLEASYDYFDYEDIEKDDWANVGGGYKMMFNSETGTLRYRCNGRKGGIDLYKVLGLV